MFERVHAQAAGILCRWVTKTPGHIPMGQFMKGQCQQKRRRKDYELLYGVINVHFIGDCAGRKPLSTCLSSLLQEKVTSTNNYPAQDGPVPGSCFSVVTLQA